MPRSTTLRLTDLRAVHQLVGECRDLGDDPNAWRRHLLAELGRLVGTGFGVAAEVGAALRPNRHDLGAADWGAENGFDRDGWLRVLDGFQQDAFSNLLVNAYVARLPAGAGVCWSRTDLMPDRDWYRSFYYQGLQRTLGGDHATACLVPVPNTAGDLSEFYLMRAIGEPDFTARQKAVVQEAVAAVAPLIGGPLARFNEASPADLAPLARRVLRCILEGDSDKQVMARLRLTRHTVNQYAKVIYRHFGVRSRASCSPGGSAAGGAAVSPGRKSADGVAGCVE